MVRALRRGFRIEEVPGAYVRRDDKTSTVRGLRDSVIYFRKLLAFRRADAAARRGARAAGRTTADPSPPR
jgi:hypothetical protein